MLSRAALDADQTDSNARWDMPGYDPAREIEVTERSWRAIDREACQPRNELHRRIIEARNRARHNETDALMRRIDATLSAG